VAVFKQNYFQRRTRPRGPKANNRINSLEVQVISSKGQNLGILSTKEALYLAEQEGLDLIEIAPKANPPVCKIIDMGKYKYELQKKANKARKKQYISELKEIKLRPGTDIHDYNFKIKNSQKFSKPLNLPVRELPETMQSALQTVPSIPQVQPSDKLGANLREIFPDKIKFDEPLPDLGIPEQADETKLKEIPDTVNLQRKKIAQLAGEEYNLHIRTRIIPKLGSYSSELYVRIRLKIIPTGKIINYEIIKKSGFAAFDKAAELAVRNALLDPLPNALAENPPYIVTIRIVPQN